jgi:hypothetical protein
MRKLTGILLLGLLLILSACEDEETTPDYNVIANAGSDQNVEVGDEVVLDGTASIDESGEGLQIEWSFESRPEGSTASIQNAGSLVAGFIPDVAGNYIVQLSVSNNYGNSFDNVTIIADDPVVNTIELDGNITENTVLEKLNARGLVDYIVTADINVSADLVIEPGVIVEFQSGRSMRITQEGSIKAIGTAQDSIVFRGTVHQPGHWKGLRVDSNNPDNELAFMEIRHGGSEGIGGTTAERNRRGNLILMSDAVRLTARNMLISEGSGHGIYIHAVNNASIQLSENIYTSNAKPAYADVTLFHVFDNESDYTGNDDDYIASTDDRNISSNTTWPRINVPFQLPGLNIDSDLTIEAGAEFVMTHSKGIYVRSDGSVNAVGEQANPIVFRGIFDERGHWNGIRIISNNPMNQLVYVEIYNGGYEGVGLTTAERNRKTSLMLDENARAVVRNVTISKSQNYPFWVRGGGNLNIEFESNTITDNEHAGWVDARYFHILDGSSSFGGNDTDRISSGTDVSMTQSRTWKKLDIPYALPQVTINENAVLTIEAGAQCEANNDGFLYVNGNAAIRVLGEENDVVAFSGQLKVPGAWRGLRIRTGNPENQLSYMEVRHGGQNGIGATSAERNRITSLMLDENARIAINNIAIHQSLEYAFWIRHVNNLNITFANNTFSGNEKLAMVDARYFHVLDGESSYSGNDDDIIRSGTNTRAIGNITWNKLDVPYELPDIVAVEGNLVIESGTRFEASQHGGIDILETGSIIALGTAEEKIEFTGGINTPGHWRGINVRSSNSNNEISHFILRHTGSNGFGAVSGDRSRRQAIQVWGGYLNISNGEISDGTGDGIRSHAGGVADRANITYSAIAGENEVGF